MVPKNVAQKWVPKVDPQNGLLFKFSKGQISGTHLLGPFLDIFSGPFLGPISGRRVLFVGSFGSVIT